MDLALFRDSPAGRIVPSNMPGIGPLAAFVPDPLPPRDLHRAGRDARGPAQSLIVLSAMVLFAVIVFRTSGR
jgi:hypothetical protein